MPVLQMRSRGSSGYVGKNPEINENRRKLRRFQQAKVKAKKGAVSFRDEKTDEKNDIRPQKTAFKNDDVFLFSENPVRARGGGGVQELF